MLLTVKPLKASSTQPFKVPNLFGCEMFPPPPPNNSDSYLQAALPS